MNIIARKPTTRTGRDGQAEFIVVDRGDKDAGARFVSATADAHSLRHSEWYWGHYFTTEAEAMAHFNSRGPK